MADVQIRRGYTAGSIGRVVELHGNYYHDHWGFGPFFETKVATELAEFMARYDERRDGFWTAVVEGRVEGAIAADGFRAGEHGAHLRWFIVSDELRGGGIGYQLISTAIDFCRSRGYKSVYLWTFEGLNAARHIYEKVGFTLAEQQSGSQWGTEVIEQRFEQQLM
jgi:GNAT superfamily N-acetyltransferase